MGYTTIATSAGVLNIYGSQWTAVSGGAISIQDIKLPVTACTDGSETMMVYTPGVGYTTYCYYTDTIEDLSLPEEQWVSKGPGWATIEGEYVSQVLPVGSGFWLNTAAAKNFSVSSPLAAE